MRTLLLLSFLTVPACGALFPEVQDAGLPAAGNAINKATDAYVLACVPFPTEQHLADTCRALYDALEAAHAVYEPVNEASK
jgi:hypothetical protein